MSFPVRIERYAIVADSGGAGRHRGGCGVERVWRILGRAAQVSVCCERSLTPPFGLAGGGPGAGARVSCIAPDGRERVLHSKGAFTAPPGAQVVMRAPGSGGYGPPSERDPSRLREDVINGYVTPEAAAERYGSSRADDLGCPACLSAR